jgi:hypothetical protein
MLEVELPHLKHLILTQAKRQNAISLLPRLQPALTNLQHVAR